MINLYFIKPMKQTILFVSILSMIFGCRSEADAPKQEAPEIIACVDSLLNQWRRDAAEANFDPYMDLMDANSVFIGTDAGENWTKTQFEAFCKPYFDKGSAWDFTVLERNIFVSNTNTLAWFDELLNTWMGVCRGSGVLEVSGGEWKLKHYVLSVSIPNQNIRSVVEIKSKSDSAFLAKYK